MFDEIRWYSSVLPSGLSCSLSSPTPRVSLGGTSPAPVIWATKLLRLEASASAWTEVTAVTSVAARSCAVGVPRLQAAGSAASASAGAVSERGRMRASEERGGGRECTPVPRGRKGGARGDP